MARGALIAPPRVGMAMRLIPALLAAALLASCAEQEPKHPDAGPSVAEAELTSGEERLQIAPKGEAATILRSGPQVPLRLPRGFTLYPGAEIISNTVVQREGVPRVLLVFETSEGLNKVMAFYRAQAKLEGIPLSLDLGAEEQASIGGSLPGGGKIAISARRTGDTTRVEFAAS